MLFTSQVYIAFFILCVLCYYLIPLRLRWVLLLVASYTFYSWSGREHLLILIFDSLVAYVFARWVSIASNGRKNKILFTGIAIIVGVLVVFKYSNFILETIGKGQLPLFAFKTDLLQDILLPIGISFYSFQAISYLVDVSRGTTKPEKHIGVFALYLSFFPQVLAGPIERAGKLIPQLKMGTLPDSSIIFSGLKTILWGYMCKVLVADKIALIIDPVFGTLPEQTSTSLIIATYLFGFEIYFDFYGYTNIAIGCGKVLGFDLTKNFRTPYVSTSFREFWHRWHITLSTWFRDYVFLPLGGSQSGWSRWLMSILVVFLVSGLWHGAAWNFVLWGAVHGTFYLIETCVRRVRSIDRFLSSNRWLAWIITFNLVMLSWFFFRVESTSDIAIAYDLIFSIPEGITGDESKSGQIFGLSVVQGALFGGLLLGIVLLDSIGWINKIISKPSQSPVTLSELLFWDIGLLMLLLFGDFGTKEFIYFRF